MYGPESSPVVASLNNLAVAYAEEDKFPEAERTFSGVLTLLSKQPKPNAPALATVYTNMSKLYRREGKPKKARKMADKAKGLREQEEAPS